MGNQAGKERLSKADVEFLKANTRYDEDTIQQWYKGFMKDCPEGKLSPPMFIQIYSKCFPCGNAEEFCAHVFRTFDSDKNGTIDFKEFLLAIDVTSSGSPEEKLNWAFRYGKLFYETELFECWTTSELSLQYSGLIHLDRYNNT